MKISFFGGLNEIGGNKILLEADGSRLFLDFGKSYKESAKYFEEYLNPRTVHGLKDYLEMDLIPYLEGVYRPDLIKLLNLEGRDFFKYQKPIIDGVLLSHGHLDHSGYLSFLDPKIPVYLSYETMATLEAFNISRPASLENEIIQIKDRSKPGLKSGKKTKRKFVVIEDQKPFKIKNLEIIPFCVDHSIPGALMFLIKTKNKNILYSGDFRLSEIPEEKKQAIEKTLFQEGIDVMLCEGTRISEKTVLREKEVYVSAKEKVAQVKGLIVVDYSLADIVRFKTLSKIAQEINRRFALPYAYFNYLAVLKEKGLPVGDLNHIVLYAKQKASLKKWEKELIKNNEVCLSSEIKKHPQKFMVALNYYQVTELIDWGVNEESYYLRAITEPHSEEMEISEQRFINWICHFKMQGLVKDEKNNFVFDRAHISGHISGKELENFLDKIKPELLIPIHTEKAEEFKEIYESSKIKLMEKGEVFEC